MAMTVHYSPYGYRLQLVILALLFTSIAPIWAYVPAVPVNDTTELKLQDDSRLKMKWKTESGSDAVYSASVSYQLNADEPTPGPDMGALVHFSEQRAGANATTLTPWIAMIECANWTDASDYWDIFTLARDRGAVAALLYTTTAHSCLINQEYLEDFEKPLDVFATKSQASAQLIENQFDGTSKTYWDYNGMLLNQSFDIVNQSLASDSVPSKTFVIATLTPKNQVGQVSTPSPTASKPPSDSPENKSKSSTSVALIILYCLAGVVAMLCFSVIIIGAVRALRHPEVYGRNAEFGDRPPPASTAAGIGHAILDTFPVIKFNRGGAESGGKLSSPSKATPHSSYHEDTFQVGRRSYKDIESHYSELTDSPANQNHDNASLDHYKTGQDKDDYEMTERPGPLSYQFQSPSRRASLVSVESEAGPSPSTMPATTHSIIARDSNPEIAAAAREFAEQRRTLVQSQVDPRAHYAKVDGTGSHHHATPTPPPTTPRRPEREREEGDKEDMLCPICLVEFQEGDNVRILPCQLAHSFHKECVDPWLLEVSSSCPLCRKDFASAPAGLPTDSSLPSMPSTSTSASEQHGTRNRFLRYLKFVQRERRRSGRSQSSSTFQHVPLDTDDESTRSARSTRGRNRSRTNDRSDRADRA